MAGIGLVRAGAQPGHRAISARAGCLARRRISRMSSFQQLVQQPADHALNGFVGACPRDVVQVEAGAIGASQARVAALRHWFALLTSTFSLCWWTSP
jgi:hypothetical protein